MDNFNLKNFINENNLGAYANLEAKKRDIDGDGDIDSDDYMAAKDAAIKKAMGKTEEVSENRFLAASMEDLEQVIRNLAHTGEMSEDEALELAIKKLESMLDGRDDMDENLKEEIGDGTFDEKMLNLTKAASIMNSYVKEFGGEEEQRMFRKIYMDLDDFENFMAYGNPDGALEEDLDAVKLSDTL